MWMKNLAYDELRVDRSPECYSLKRVDECHLDVLSIRTIRRARPLTVWNILNIYLDTYLPRQAHIYW